jgi:predicted hydrocarbon binding protein
MGVKLYLQPILTIISVGLSLQRSNRDLRSDRDNLSLKPSTLQKVTNMSVSTRPSLGDFSSIVCFKSVITGMEEALGEKATAISLISAGRARGKSLANELGLSGSTDDLSVIAAKLNEALGTAGTRLTAVDKIVKEGDLVKVYCSETVCSAGELPGSSRKCTFTMGAIWGALSEVTGKKFRGVHTDSVLRGGSHDVFEFTPVD